MPINSRDKGAVGERELANVLKEHGYEARRGCQFQGSADSPDVVGLPGFHVECKRVERGSLYAWLAQSIRDAGAKLVPIVVHRRNRHDWVVIIRLTDFLNLLKWMY